MLEASHNIAHKNSSTKNVRCPRFVHQSTAEVCTRQHAMERGLKNEPLQVQSWDRRSMGQFNDRGRFVMF